MISSFLIKVGKQSFDYRLGHELDLNKIKGFFEDKKFTVGKLSFTGRHIIGKLKNENNQLMFLKLATSHGMSIVTENECQWNGKTSEILPVPKKYYSGYFEKDYFYHVCSFFAGPLLNKDLLEKNIDNVIALAETIGRLKIDLLPADIYHQGKNHQEKFYHKTLSHFQNVPEKISETYELKKLLNLIKINLPNFGLSARHGDFAPWHMILLSGGTIGLIDGEHAMMGGVEYYDLGYLIQRVFSVWKEKELAKKIYKKLMIRGYKKNKLKTILFARTIGGFLDESLSPNPDYSIHEEFKDWVLLI